jgi:hypothetical protein
MDPYISGRKNTPERQEKSTHPGWWAGDVWKLLLIFKEYRPDLRVVCLDAQPTGLAIITNLYPESRILREKYIEIATRYANILLEDYGVDKFLNEIDLRSTYEFSAVQDFGPFFWS